MIVIRVLQVAIALLGLYFLGMAIYDKFIVELPGENEKSGFALYLSLFGASILMSFLLWRLAKALAKHLG
jgi:hypothetical protein